MDRWAKCVEYCVKAMKSGEADPSIAVLKYLANKHDLTVRECAWLALLYSTCYSASTTWFMFKNLPELNELTKTDMDHYWFRGLKSLVFQSDRRYVKNMNWFTPILSDYKRKIGSRHEKVLSAPTDSTIFHLITSVKYCGRFTAFLFIDAFQALFSCDIPINPKKWDDWDTAGEGLCHAVGWDDLAEEHAKTERYPKSAHPLLDGLFDELKRDIEKHGVAITDSELETALCAYRKLFKQSRYYGYYIDRQQEEFYKNAKAFDDLGASEFLMDELWEARKAALDNSLLGELKGWTGVRKERYAIFMETGGDFE